MGLSLSGPRPGQHFGAKLSSRRGALQVCRRPLRRPRPDYPAATVVEVCTGALKEPFGWAKAVGSMAQKTLRGTERLGAQFTMTTAACNLTRLLKLLAT
ncbi:hypothetical protein ACSSVZ_005201 [Amorphus sp. MBR-141]